MNTPKGYCIVVPHYNHDLQLANYLPALVELALPILIVDDASSAASQASLRKLCSNEAADIRIFHHSHNRGKGAALLSAANLALRLGYTHMVCVDADGQHLAHDIPNFIDASCEYPEAIFSGLPQFGEDIPTSRLYGRMITNGLSRIEAHSTAIHDAMCGFRVYPLAQLHKLQRRYLLARGMAFDTEVLVYACWSDIDIRFIPTAVSYPDNGLSHFRMIWDNVAMTEMHIRLLLGSLLRLPQRFA